MSRKTCTIHYSLEDEDISTYFKGLFGADELDLNELVKDTQSIWS